VTQLSDRPVVHEERSQLVRKLVFGTALVFTCAMALATFLAWIARSGRAPLWIAGLTIAVVAVVALALYLRGSEYPYWHVNLASYSLGILILVACVDPQITHFDTILFQILVAATAGTATVHAFTWTAVLLLRGRVRRMSNPC
jgi:peptidoglycan/LPS O-acetylase OafA/YrhL